MPLTIPSPSSDGEFPTNMLFIQSQAPLNGLSIPSKSISPTALIPFHIPLGKSTPNHPKTSLDKSYSTPTVTSNIALGIAIKIFIIPVKKFPSVKSLIADFTVSNIENTLCIAAIINPIGPATFIIGASSGPNLPKAGKNFKIGPNDLDKALKGAENVITIPCPPFSAPKTAFTILGNVIKNLKAENMVEYPTNILNPSNNLGNTIIARSNRGSTISITGLANSLIN